MVSRMSQAQSGEQLAVDAVIEQNAHQSPLELDTNLVGSDDVETPIPASLKEPEANTEAEEESTEEQESEAEQGSSRRTRRGGFQKKIERLSSERERLAAEVAALRAQLAGNAVPAPSQSGSDNAPSGEPRQDDYSTFEDYTRALARFEAREILKQERQQQEGRSLEQNHNQQVNEARAKYKDFDEAIADYGIEELPAPVKAAILHSDMGAEVAYYLANNPEGDELFNVTDPMKAAIRIGEISAKIKMGNQKAKAAPKTTKAPPPITPLKAKAVSSKTIYDDDLPYEDFRNLAGRS